MYYNGKSRAFNGTVHAGEEFKNVADFLKAKAPPPEITEGGLTQADYALKQRCAKDHYNVSMYTLKVYAREVAHPVDRGNPEAVLAVAEKIGIRLSEDRQYPPPDNPSTNGAGSDIPFAEDVDEPSPPKTEVDEPAPVKETGSDRGSAAIQEADQKAAEKEKAAAELKARNQQLKEEKGASLERPYSTHDAAPRLHAISPNPVWLMYSEMTGFMDIHTGMTKPRSREEWAKRLGLSKQAWRRAEKKLLDEGMLKRHRDDTRSWKQPVRFVLPLVRKQRGIE